MRVHDIDDYLEDDPHPLPPMRVTRAPLLKARSIRCKEERRRVVREFTESLDKHSG